MSAMESAAHLLYHRSAELAELLLPRASKFELYKYTPSLPAAILFIVLFALTTGLHSYQMFRTRTWFFIPFLLGGLCELVGYAGRAVSASQAAHRWTLTPFIVQSVLLLVAPALFAASIYMELARIVELVDGDVHLFISRRWLTTIFVFGDVVSFLMQGSGGGLMGTKKQSSRDLGEKIIVGGLFVQIVFFGVFVLAAALFHTRVQRQPTSRSPGMPWRKHMLALYLTSIFILVRSIFRVVEFLQGWDGYLLRYEAFLYVFDSALMLAVMVIMNWIHPSEIRSLLKGGKSVKGLRMVDMAGSESP